MATKRSDTNSTKLEKVKFILPLHSALQQSSQSFEITTIATPELKPLKGDATNTESDDRKAFTAKPRHDSTALRVHFKSQMLELRTMPYEYLESTLYGVSSTHVRALYGKPLDLDVVKHMHHIYELKQREVQLSVELRNQLNQDLEEVLNANASALEEYRAVSTLLLIASALLVKWNMVNYDEYSYRLNGHVIQVHPLNLFTMNSSLLTMETLWYCQLVESPPLCRFVDVSTMQYAIVLRVEVARTLKYLLTMNNGDFWATPSIQGYMAALSPSLQYQYHMQADFEQSKPEYQGLRQPEGLAARCHKSPSQAKCLVLKKTLRDLEAAYRAFEKSLLNCFMRKLLHLDLEPV